MSEERDMARMTLDVATEIWDGTCDECGAKPANNRACYKPEHVTLRRHAFSKENLCVGGAILCNDCRKRVAPTLEDRVERIEKLLERLVEAHEGGGRRAEGAIPAGQVSTLVMTEAQRLGNWSL